MYSSIYVIAVEISFNQSLFVFVELLHCCRNDRPAFAVSVLPKDAKKIITMVITQFEQSDYPIRTIKIIRT